MYVLVAGSSLDGCASAGRRSRHKRRVTVPVPFARYATLRDVKGPTRWRTLAPSRGREPARALRVVTVGPSGNY